ncbi:AAA family ATPase [Marivita hallyeonensis]|uniref:MoxR-like ATPase n=1 Tax=Marivita hallyeonensis TaxID=996342 RepID=A0A1M5VJP9_9RHOB|nr:MoxR family ATPase [Marivita hallyeonensis]SHH75479.1 MoxR-like ATPase [Marivita hallyeonensis]
MSVNAATLSAGDALEVLSAAWDAQVTGGLTTSWMLHGRPGVGKTQLVQTLAQQRDAELYDIRLTTIEPQDLRGLPYYDHETKKTLWYRPEDLPDAPDRPAVLFLDELTAASPYLQPTVYGLLQERRVGRHRLPDSVFIVAAGNTVEDGAIAYEMGTALSDRLVHLHVKASAKDWLERYAVDQRLHPAVTAFLRARPDLLDTTEDTLRRGDMIACTPRSWERVSQIMHAIPDRRMRDAMVAGTIGIAPAADFARVADELDSMVTVADLLQTPRSKRPELYPTSMNGLVGLIYGLVAQTDAETIKGTIEVMADIRSLKSDAVSALPLAELTSFGFELLIRKALANGLEDGFRGSDAYAQYAAERAKAEAG